MNLAVNDAKIWALERKVFQAIMMRTGIERQKERMEFLTRYRQYTVVCIFVIQVCHEIVANLASLFAYY